MPIVERRVGADNIFKDGRRVRDPRPTQLSFKLSKRNCSMGQHHALNAAFTDLPRIIRRHLRVASN